jgi:hypothetical protein
VTSHPWPVGVQTPAGIAAVLFVVVSSLAACGWEPWPQETGIRVPPRECGLTEGDLAILNLEFVQAADAVLRTSGPLLPEGTCAEDASNYTLTGTVADRVMPSSSVVTERLAGARQDLSGAPLPGWEVLGGDLDPASGDPPTLVFDLPDRFRAELEFVVAGDGVTLVIRVFPRAPFGR